MTSENTNDILDDLLNNIPDNTDTGLDHIESEETEEEIEIISAHNFFIEGFTSNQIVDAKEYTKFIRSAEKLVRVSVEYSKYIGWLKSTSVGIDKCSILSNVSSEDASIEMHHYPFSLYDLCCIVANKQFESNNRVTSFSVANEVLDLHFNNMVGLVPLTETIHQLAHSGSIVINLKQVFGKVVDFIEKYKDFIKEEDIDKLKKLIVLSRSNTIFANESFLTLNGTSENAVTPITLQTIQRIQGSSNGTESDRSNGD